jgi:hypothetical protein
MTTNTPLHSLPVDRSLTPDNAHPRGYTFVCDILPAFVDQNPDLMNSLGEAGGIFGLPSTTAPEDAMGLYQLLDNRPSGKR